MPGKTYLIRNDKSLQVLNQHPYPNEDFQALLKQYSHLLAGDQMNAAAQR